MLQRMQNSNFILQSPVPGRIKMSMEQADCDINDEGLMLRVCNGDHRAFSVLVERYSDMAYAAAYRMCSDRVEAEDIVQEAFMKLWQKPQSYDPAKGAKLSTWFYRVVSNLAIDKMRKKKPQKNPDVLERMQADTTPADDALQMSQEQVAIENAIQALPERQRLALNLCFYEGLSNKEAADIIGVGVKALESLLMRAKAKLKSELIKSDYSEDKGRESA